MNYIGIDFGTSNSLAALARDGRNVEFVEFPDGKASNPTILYFPEKSKKHYIGTDAVHRYLENLEVSRDAGRLMLSIKSLLPEANFDYTTIVGFGNHTAADLAARFLTLVKEYAEAQFGCVFEGVVLGRPVDFNPLALERLEEAARKVGFRNIVFWMEPVAAALAYEMTHDREELVCVVDLGGGTSDICVIQTSPARSLTPDRANDIKAVRGVNQAGDEMSSRIMRGKLGPHFGLGSSFHSMGKTLPFPVHLIEKISKWHRVSLLKNPRDIGSMVEILRTSDRKEAVERLLNLVRGSYGFELFRAIDETKKKLSNQDAERLRFRPLELDERLERTEFEELIVPIVEGIAGAMLGCLSDAGVKADRVDRVILTGGTSQIPMLEDLVKVVFGEDKIIRPDYFASVATGLGLAAGRLSD